MCPAAARALPALLLALCALSPLLSAKKPLRPRNVTLTSVDKGLKVTWEPPNELDGRPVDRYSIGYGKSMRSLRFITVDKDRRSEVLEDVEPGVLHFLKMSAENEEGLSKPVYRAETPRGGDWVKLDGFAVEGGSTLNGSLSGRRSPELPIKVNPRPSVQLPTVQQRAPQSSSGPEAPRRGGYLPIRPQNKHRMDLSQPQADQRNANKPKLASESVYVVSLQAQKAPQRSSITNKAYMKEHPAPEPEVVEEVEDITVRVLSPQSVLITWVDPLVQKQKSIPEGTRQYTVRYREKGESARWEYKDTTQRRLIIENLSADGMYEFSVRITQGDQEGKWSVSVFQRTPESVPSGPPENFEVKPLRGKGTAITATWDPPDEPNGKIREYILSYAPALKPFGTKSITYRGTVTSATVDGLTPGDRYIFKIRAVNRRGQGPQSKALSVAMPGSSTAASRHSTQSKSPSRTSIYDKAEHQEIEEMEESDTHTTTSPPTSKKHHHLPQTRPYHRVLSTVRGSVRKPGSKLRTPLNRGMEEEDEDTPTETPQEDNEDEVNANEASEDTQTESMNNVPSKTGEEEQKVSAGVKDSSSLLKGSVINSQSSSKIALSSADSSTKAIKDHSQSPRMSSPVSGSRLRQPSITTSTSRSQNQNGASSNLPNSHKSVIMKKDHTSSYPEKKMSKTDEKSTPSPQDTKTETDRQSSSSSLPSSSGSSRVSSQGSRSGSGYVYSNGRRVISQGHRLQTGNQKTGMSSSTSSQSTTPTRSNTPDKMDSQSTSENDHHESKVEAKNKESPHSSYKYTTTHPPLTKEEKTQEVDNSKDSYSASSHPPSRENPSHTGQGSSLTPRNSRIVMGSRRKDGRIPWSRTASSVGAEKPNLRGSHSTGGQFSGKTKDFPTTYTSKHLNPTTAKPTVNSVLDVSTSETSNDRARNTHSKSINDHEDDYLDEVTKETYEISNKDAVLTASAKTTTTQQPVQTSESSTQSVFNAPRRPVLGSNGKFRSTVLASRLNDLRLRGRLQPVQNTQLGSPDKKDTSLSSISTSSSSFASQQQQTLTSEQDTGFSRSNNGRSTEESSSRSSLKQTSAGENSNGEASPDLKPSTPARNPVVGSRLRYPTRSNTFSRGKTPFSLHKPANGQGKNGRPNLTATNGKMSPTSNENTKANGVKYITGPDGSRWVVDLEKGVLMNEDGKVLQDSRGRPRKVVLGEDGKTIFDEQGSPLVNQEGMALFGHGRDTRPVVNPKDKILTVGGKPVVGLDRPTPRTTTTTTTTTTSTSTTTTTTTTPEPTTTVVTTLESTTDALPTCPPGMFSRLDINGVPLVDTNGVLDCYSNDEFLMETTMPPTTIQLPTTTLPSQPEFRHLNNSPSSEFDASGKKRFTAPYVNYIQKDPGAPCSLTEALEYLQVDVLTDLIAKDHYIETEKQPPKHKPQNLTVIAMEGCHSFVILDWARPVKDDMVSGYMVHSASYDDVLNNRWSSHLSSGTHLPVENLKPNSRYYFKVQAKNPFGLGPISDQLIYVTESDDPLLIERPPGGEPIWIPFTFRYNPAHSYCKGSQFVKRTWYRKFVGVVLCNSLRYKIFMGDGLKETFYSVADSYGHGEDHCQFVDSHMDGRTGPHGLSLYLPPAQGYYRSFRQEPVSFGPIGRRTAHHFVGWYECGVPIPGKW